jgi:hypothetical protein
MAARFAAPTGSHDLVGNRLRPELAALDVADSPHALLMCVDGEFAAIEQTMVDLEARSPDMAHD